MAQEQTNRWLTSIHSARATDAAAPDVGTQLPASDEQARYTPAASGFMHVARPRLLALLVRQPAPALTLISAPAGSGKSTLLRAWAAMATAEAASGGTSEQVILIALDAADNDPARFWARIAAALHAAPGCGAWFAPDDTATPLSALLGDDTASEANGRPHPASARPANAPTPVALALDDYHAITTPAISETLAALLDALPAGLRVVIATRHDPPLPLARLRARNQLLELRAAELRFTEAEADAFLRDTMGLALDAAQMSQLERRTEGWVAGLQLAALSLRGRADVAAFLDTFDGTHRFIVDYLASEVLARESAAIQDFLLRTSVPDRLCAPLCAVVGAGGDEATAAKLLEHIERTNLFLLPLDDTRRWYRYHALFAGFLRGRLRQSLAADEVAALHRRAAEWYEAAGMTDEAIGHAIAAGDWAHAARQLEAHGMRYLLRGEMMTALGWLRALPEAVVYSHSALCTLYGGVLTNGGEFAGAGRWLAAAERAIVAAAALPTAPDAQSAGASGEHQPAGDAQSVGAHGVRPLADVRPPAGDEVGAFGATLGDVRAAQAVLAGFRGDVALAEEYTRQALALLPPGSAFVRGIVAAGMAAAHWWAGDMTSAAAAFGETRAIGALMGIAHIELAGICGGGFVDLACFRPRHAHAAFELALRRAERPGGVTHPLAGMARAGLGAVLREWNELDAAERHLRDASEGSERWGDANLLAQIYLHLARIQQARGDSAAALALLDQAREECEGRGIVHQLPTIAACRAFLWLMQGDVAAAASWADASGLAFDAEITFLSEMALLTLARVRLAQGRAAEVLAGLEQLEPRARAAGRTANAHEMTMLRALACDQLGERERACDLLAGVLTAAEPEGYVRLFADEGAPMADLLLALESIQRMPLRPNDDGVHRAPLHPRASVSPHAATALPTPDYLRRLLDAMGIQHALHPPADAQSVSHPCLNEREREVLRLLAGGLSNAAIAAELIVAPSTIKWHVKHLYAKLGAHSRTQAVARARGMGMLE